jgi:hypothetical protein
MVVLDPDVLSLMQRRQDDRFARLTKSIETEGEQVYVTIVTFEEQVRCWLAACARPRTPERYSIEAGRLRELLLDFGNWEVLPFDGRSAAEYQEV